MTRSTTSLAAVLSLLGGGALADSHGGDPNAAMTGYVAALETSVDLIPSDSTGDADADFLTVMIPYNQTAVDIARIAAESGDNPHVQELARAIIVYREAEIAAMQALLAAIGTDDSGEAEQPASE